MYLLGIFGISILVISKHNPIPKHTLSLNLGTPNIKIQYFSNSIYWNGTIPNNPDTDQDYLKTESLKKIFDKTVIIELLIATLGLVSGAMSVGGV